MDDAGVAFAGKRRVTGWSWISQTLRIKRKRVAILFLLTLAIYGFSVLFPVTMQMAIDGILSGAKPSGIALLGACALLAVGLEVFLGYFRQGIVIALGRFLDRRLSRAIFAHLMRVRLDGQETNAGELLNHFQQSSKVRDFVLHQVPHAVFEVGVALVSLALVFYYDIWVGTAFLVAIPLLATSAKNQLQALNKLSTAYYGSINDRQNMAAEAVRSLHTIRSLAIEGNRISRWISVTENMLSHLQQVMELSRTYLLRSQLASRVLGLVALGIGCWRLFEGHISVGDLLALQILAGRIAGPVLASSDLYRNYQEVSVALSQISSFLETSKEESSVSPPVRGFDETRITLSSVWFAYKAGSEPVLKDVSVDLRGGGVVALVGHNGSGKSTLIKLLLGLQRNYTGDVSVGGRGIQEYDPRWLRKQMAVVEQDATLLSGRIRDNLDPERRRTAEELEAALQFSDSLSFVKALPGGLDYEVAEAGRGLSGGQRQRIAIARAVLQDPKIAFLDEPAAFLDAEAAIHLESKIAEWGRDRLVVMATHNLIVAKNSSRVLVLDGGRLVGDGAHEQLIGTVPRYAALWSSFMRDRTVPQSAL